MAVFISVLLAAAFVIFRRKRRRALNLSPLATLPFSRYSLEVENHPSARVLASKAAQLRRAVLVALPGTPIPAQTRAVNKKHRLWSRGVVAEEQSSSGGSPGPSREGLLAQENVALRARIREMEILSLPRSGSTVPSEMPPDYVDDAAAAVLL